MDLPFLGVNNKDACPKLFNMDDTKAECPLKAGGTYKYKNSFKILDLYPEVRVVLPKIS